MVTRPTQTLLTHLEDSVRAAKWLTAADAAAVELARMIARQLTASTDLRETAALAKQFNDILQSLGLNVAGRTGKAEAPKEGEVNPLAALRQEASRKPKAKTAQPATRKSAKPRAASRKVR